MKHRRLASLALGCLLTLGGAPARAEKITFDDIAAPSGGTPIANGYHGFSWNNFAVINPSQSFPFNSSAGVVSPDNVAYNLHGSPATLSSSTPFDLNSGYFTGAKSNGLNIRAMGYLNGVLKYDTTFAITKSGPTFEQLDFLGVDSVKFKSAAGSDKLSKGLALGRIFELDNLLINDGGVVQIIQRVPEPTSLALLGIGAAVTGMYGWRRRMK